MGKNGERNGPESRIYFSVRLPVASCQVPIIPTRDGPIRLSPMARFVTPRGGGYFFLPGKKLLEFLSV
jgi:hypothetical protein